MLYGLALKVLIYLFHTADYGVVYDFSTVPSVDKENLKMVAYADANWGGQLKDACSTTGWILQLDQCPIYAGSKTQKRPTLSTAEAEISALEFVCKEIEWTKSLLEELGFQLELPVTIFQDNNAAIRLAKDPVNAPRTKYFRISQAYIRMLVNKGVIRVEYLPSQEHPCDILNKVTTKRAQLKHLPKVLGHEVIGFVNLARWKQTGRPRPVAHWRRLGSRMYSKSDSNPPMACRCNVCKTWFPWSKAGQRWLTCWERDAACENNDDVSVQCFQCMRLAKKIRGLENGWYCTNCPTPRLLRTLPKRTARYGTATQ